MRSVLSSENFFTDCFPFPAESMALGRVGGEGSGERREGRGNGSLHVKWADAVNRLWTAAVVPLW